MTIATGEGLAEALGRIAAMPAFLRAAIDRVPDGKRAKRPVGGEFALVERARAELAALLATVTPAGLAREGIFGGERITLRRLILMIDEHDREHRAQLQALLAFLGAA